MPSEVTVFAGTTVLPRVLLAGVAPWPHAKLHQITITGIMASRTSTTLTCRVGPMSYEATSKLSSTTLVRDVSSLCCFRDFP